MRRFWTLVALAVVGLLGGAALASGNGRPTHTLRTTHRHRTGDRWVSQPRHHKHHKHRRHRRHRRKHGAQGTAPAAPPTTPTGGGTLPSGPCPSDPPGSSQAAGGHTYAFEGMDTFTRAAPVGSFAQAGADQIVYIGDHGMSWTGYGDGWRSTYSGGAEGYQPSTVLSVHDGVLDFYLHNDSSGNPVGADPSPLPAGNRYQTYGVWSFCERVAPDGSSDLADFHQAPLLWPQNDGDAKSAESDYPEATLNKLDFSGYSHYGGSGSQDAFDVRSVQPSFDSSQWHVYTQAWGPGFRSYYVDGGAGGYEHQSGVVGSGALAAAG